MATRTSIKRLNRTTALLGRVLLCLALLFNLSTVAVEDLCWSAADLVLDEYRGSSVPMLAKTGDRSALSCTDKKINSESWCGLEGRHQPHHESPLTLSAQHHRASSTFNSLVFNSPFPPRAPTA